MAIKYKYLGIKKGRSFVMNEADKTVLGNYLQKFEDGKELEMTVGPRYKKRTSGQPDEETNFNGYLWGVVYKIIADEIGELDLDYVHYWAQIKVGNVKGMPDKSVVPAGTSELSGGEFAEYCSKVRMWASSPGAICENGMYIPEPNEAEYGV
jgi:hypothetical protein